MDAETGRTKRLYFEDSLRTVFAGRRFSVLCVLILVYCIFQDTVLLQLTSTLPWRLLGMVFCGIPRHLVHPAETRSGKSDCLIRPDARGVMLSTCGLSWTLFHVRPPIAGFEYGTIDAVMAATLGCVSLLPGPGTTCPTSSSSRWR